MGCGSSKVSTEQIEKIQNKSGGMISEKDIRHWHSIWVKLAPNGKMTEEQFVKFILKIGTGGEHDARNMFKMMDKDKNGEMDFDEFILILLLPKSTEEITAEQFANLCMTIYDQDQNGVITKDELLKFALTKAKAEGRTSNEQRAQITMVVNKLVEFIDENADGQITKEEIVRAINRDPQLKQML